MSSLFSMESSGKRHAVAMLLAMLSLLWQSCGNAGWWSVSCHVQSGAGIVNGHSHWWSHVIGDNFPLQVLSLYWRLQLLLSDTRRIVRYNWLWGNMSRVITPLTSSQPRAARIKRKCAKKAVSEGRVLLRWCQGVWGKGQAKGGWSLLTS